MATKKTAKKSSGAGEVTKAQRQFAKADAAAKAAPKKYDTIGAVMVAKAKGALPRGAKFVIRAGRVQLRVETKHTGVTLYDGDAGEVARWGLRKLGLKADHAA